jgi:hypothetical protein
MAELILKRWGCIKSVISTRVEKTDEE